MLNHSRLSIFALSAAMGVAACAGPDSSRSTLVADGVHVANGKDAATLTAKLLDSSGQPVSGAMIALTSNVSVDQWSGADGQTNAKGIFTAHLTTTKAGARTVTATVVGKGINFSGTVTFKAGPADAAHSTFTATPTTAVADGTSTLALEVTLQDAFDNPVPNQAVSFSDSGTGSTFTPQTATTSAEGSASATVSSTKAEVKTLTASAGSLSLKTDVTFTPGKPSGTTSTLDAPTGPIVADGTARAAYVVHVMDANSNPVSGSLVQVAVTGSGITFAAGAASGTTGETGTYAFALSGTRAGSSTVTVTLDGGATLTASLSLVPGPVDGTQSRLIVTPATVVADGVQTAQISFLALDKFDNPVPGVALSLSVSGSANALTPATPAATGADGTTALTLASTMAETKVITATDSAGNTYAGLVNFVSGAPVAGHGTVNVSGPATADGISPVILSVRVHDASYNPVAGAAVNVVVDNGSAVTLSNGGSATTDAAGGASISATSTRSGSFPVSVAVGDFYTAQATLVFVAGPPVAAHSSLTLAQDDVVADGATVATVTLVAHDAYDNPVPALAPLVVSSEPTDLLGPAGGVTSADGSLALTMTATRAGAHMLTVTLALGQALTQVVHFVAGAPNAAHSSLKLAQDDIVADGTTAASVTLVARDAFDNPIAGLSPQAASSEASDVVAPANGTTGADGSLVLSVTATAAGKHTLTVTLAQGQALTQDLTFVAGPPDASHSSLTLAKDGLVADGATAASIALIARDAHDNPISGLSPRLASTDPTDVLGPANGATGSDGSLSLSMTATHAGAHTLTVTLAQGQALTQLVNFVAGAPNAAHSSLELAQDDVVADGTTAASVTLVARDAFDNPIAGLAPTVASSQTTDVVAPADGMTGADGTLALSVTATAAGKHVLIATLATGQVLTVDITFVAGAPDKDHSSLTQTGSATVDGTKTLTVLLEDAHGNPVPNTAVVFQVSGSTNTIKPADGAALTGTDGTGSVTLGSTLAETKTVSATVGVPAQFLLTADVTFAPGAPSPTQSDFVAAPAQVPADGTSKATLTVTAQDQYGNLVPSIVATFTATGGDITVTAGPPSGADGVYAATATATTMGTRTITARLSTGDIPTTATVDFIAPAPATHAAVLVSPSGTTCDLQNSNQWSNGVGRKIAIDSANIIYFAYRCGGALQVGTSIDGGASFSAPVAVGTLSPSEWAVTGGADETADLAAIDTSNDLYFSNTTDGGKSWSTPVKLDSGFNVGWGLAVVTNGDDVWIVAMTSSTWQPRVYRSSDGGKTFDQTTLSGFSGTAFGSLVYDPPTGNLFLVGDNPSMFLALSKDDGATFAAAVNAPGGCFYSNWTLGGGSVFVSGDSLVDPNATAYRIDPIKGTDVQLTGLGSSSVQWRSLSADASGNLYAAVDGGSTLTAYRVAASATAAGTGQQLSTSASYPMVTALDDGSHALVGWQEGTGVELQVVGF